MKQKLSSCGPVHGIVGRVLHCWENTFPFPVSSSFLDEPIGVDTCEIIIRVPSASVRDVINRIHSGIDVDVALIECQPNPERSEDARDGRSAESHCSTAGDV